MTPDLLRAALRNPNAQAWLRLIRAGETHQGDAAYRTMFGGGQFDGWQHPRKLNSAAGLTSTAAGAYQFLSRTWDECVEALGLTDFSPESQDLAALFLTSRRGALQDVLDGLIEVAIAKCCREWASLPGSPYGQPTRTLAQALSVYKAYGGVIGPVPAEPLEVPTIPDTMPPGEAPDWTPPEVTMPALGPIIAAVLPSLVEHIPKLARIFGSGSAVSERNIRAAELAVDTVVKATGAVNAQEAAERLKSDPAAVQAATKAIDGIWYELSEAGGGGIEGARKASAVYLQPGAAGFWLNPSFWISLILIAMPLMLLIDVLFVHPESYVGELRTQIVTGVLMVIGMVGGYWIGTSISSAKKDERAV